ncbi:MAG: response regulator SirA [Candidatus Hydrogenedentota bacterium]|nr:MAG: response regulator SirA [Candidatus Hydrogenedentota bacterium]
METTPFTHVVKRDGSVVPFTDVRITNAIYRAAIAVGGRDRRTAEYLTTRVIRYLLKKPEIADPPHVEQIQDAIEKVLIEQGHAQTAKAFILYRNERARNRAERETLGDSPARGDGIPWRKVWKSLNWAIDHNVFTVEQLNARVTDGSFRELVRECEEAYQLDIARAADRILRRRDEIRFVIVAGPSSSGKTTSTIKVAEHLRNEGFVFVPFHVDNYFLDLELHPKDEHGDYDYETPEAIDLELLNRDLRALYEGKEVRPPFFNFKTGKREGTAPPVRIGPGEILLIDSLHGLHDPVTAGIPNEAKCRLYIEPLLQCRSPDGGYIRWTDIRLIRRIVRDSRDRNVAPKQTLEHWHYVRRSELRYIVPHANSADYVINSSLPYELPLWAARVGNLFRQWTQEYTDNTEHADAARRAARVSKLLDSLSSWEDETVIPKNALLREFIGGSSYDYSGV